MLSAVISSERSYSTVPLAGQPIHQRFVRSGLLILGAAPLNLQRLQQIRTDDLLLSNHFVTASHLWRPVISAGSAYRYAVRTVSSRYLRVFRAVSEDFKRLISSFFFRILRDPPPFIW